MSTIQNTTNIPQKKTYRLVKVRSNSHQFKLKNEARKNFLKNSEKNFKNEKNSNFEKNEKKNFSTFTTSHMPKSGSCQPKMPTGEKKVARYHQVLQSSFPKDFDNTDLKRVKIKVKVKGDKETFYDYFSKNEIFLRSEIMNEKLPKKIKVKLRGQKEIKEPNPASLKFPKIIKKLLKKEKKERQLVKSRSKNFCSDDVKKMRKWKKMKVANAMIHGDDE